MPQGMKLSPDLEDIRPLLEEWCVLTAAALTTFPFAGRYSFIEKTFVDLLSAAAWRLGISAITEVPTSRGAPPARGRADLLVKLPVGLIAAEAKICAVAHPDDAARVIGRLEDACANASALPSDLAPRRLALSFGLLEIQRVPCSELLGATTKALATTAHPLLAWSAVDSSAQELTYPGCIVAGQLV